MRPLRQVDMVSARPAVFLAEGVVDPQDCDTILCAAARPRNLSLARSLARACKHAQSARELI